MAAAVEFDFATKRERAIPPEAAAASCAAGLFCWVDVDASADGEASEALLAGLGVPAAVVSRALGPGGDGRCDAWEECLHFSVAAVAPPQDGFATVRVDLIAGARFLVTVRRGDVPFLDEVRRTYRQDFLRFAQSPGFLLFECWDRLVKGYEEAHRRSEDRVRAFRGGLFGDADEALFARAAETTRDLLDLRRAVVAARSVVDELVARHSPFVPETTRPHLERMIGTLDHLAADLAVERESIAESLNLYLGLVSHRTNRVLNRLTVVSLVFLPLTFLCGVYGMNFEVLPETEWDYGYAFFWGVAALTAAAMLAYLKRLGLW